MIETSPAPPGLAPAKVLLVDDDLKLARLLRVYLEREGFELTFAADGPNGLTTALRGGQDAILLDVMLPGLDGFTVCRRIRGAGNTTPLIMLSARGDEADRVTGLELGADDYISKPFSPRELLARLRAVLRRSRPRPLAEVPLRLGKLALDPRTRVASLEDRPLPLTGYEFELLRLLMTEAGHVLSRDRILDQLKGEAFETFDRSIDVHVSRLRQKLGDDSKQPKLIKTIRGIGYLLVTGTKERTR